METFPSLMCIFFSEESFFLLKKPWKKKLSFCEKALKQKDLEKKKNLQENIEKIWRTKKREKKFGKRKRLKTNLAKENRSKKKTFEQKTKLFRKKKRPFFF